MRQIKQLQILIFICYLLFILGDLFALGWDTRYFKYATVLLSFIISLHAKKDIIKINIFLTLICDYFLLFTTDYFIGISIFIAVHTLYISRHSPWPNKKRRITYFCLMLTPLFFLFHWNRMLTISLIYTIFFSVNLFCSIFSSIGFPSYQTNTTAQAMIFFLFCDLSTAAANITGNSFLYHIIWIFYTPSQMLLALSSLTAQARLFPKVLKPLHKQQLDPLRIGKRK